MRVVALTPSDDETPRLSATSGESHLSPEGCTMTALAARNKRRREALHRIATERGDIAAVAILEQRPRTPLTETEMRMMWGDR